MANSSLPQLASSHAVFFDFDGTLAPLQADPDAVVLPPQGARVLEGVATRLDGALAILSGRDIRDLTKRIPLSLWRMGGHGMDICAPGDTPSPLPETPPALAKAIESVTRDFPGVVVERKGPVVAIHYRQIPDQEIALKAALEKAVTTYEDYMLQAGHMIFEAKPPKAHKGRSLVSHLNTPPFKGRIPIMVGDDTTDEDAMAAAQDCGGWAIKVGEGKSVANYRLPDPGAVWTWLEQAIA